MRPLLFNIFPFFYYTLIERHSYVPPQPFLMLVTGCAYLLYVCPRLYLPHPDFSYPLCLTLAVPVWHISYYPYPYLQPVWYIRAASSRGRASYLLSNILEVFTFNVATPNPLDTRTTRLAEA